MVLKTQQNGPHCKGGFGIKYPLVETDNFLVVCDVHPLIEGHILVIPKEHISCMGSLNNESFKEYGQLYEKTMFFLKNAYGSAAVFEHGIAGQTVFHAHTHFFPFKCSIQDIVPEKETLKGLENIDDIKAEFNKEGTYLYVALDGEKWLVDTKIGFPRFFRDRFANALGVSERGNWKKTEENKELMASFEVDVRKLIDKWNLFFNKE